MSVLLFINFDYSVLIDVLFFYVHLLFQPLIDSDIILKLN
jgi:hypothetical protein